MHMNSMPVHMEIGPCLQIISNQPPLFVICIKFAESVLLVGYTCVMMLVYMYLNDISLRKWSYFILILNLL